MLINSLRRLRCRWKALWGKDIFIPVQRRVKTEFHGSTCGGWSILQDSLTSDSVVYSIGIGEDATFDLSVIEKYECAIHAFDPTPRSVVWVQREIKSPLFRFEAAAIADHDGTLELFFPSNPDFVSTSLAKSKSMTGSSFIATCVSLPSLMGRLGHTRIHVLKMDIEGAEYTVLEHALKTGVLRRVDQLLIEFHHWMEPFTVRHTQEALQLVRGEGFYVAWVSPSGHEVLFVNASVQALGQESS